MKSKSLEDLNFLIIIFTIIGCIPFVFFNKGYIVLFINNISNNELDVLFKYITYLGNGFILIPLILLFILHKKKDKIAVLILSFFIHGVLIFVLKNYVYEDLVRPTVFFQNEVSLRIMENIELHSSKTFPSGHSATAIVSFTFLSLLYKKRYLTTLFFLCALAVGVSRIYLLQHFYIDVYFGTILGYLSVIMSIYLIRVLKWKKNIEINFSNDNFPIELQKEMSSSKVSIIVPLFNEEDNILPLLINIEKSLKELDYEVILVDDGSIDNTVENIKRYASKHVRLLIFYKNYGQTTAISAGIDAAKGDYIITMDGDLQNDPSDIPAMLQMLLTEEWDVVAGRRIKRKDGILFRKLPSKLANMLIRKFTNIHITDYGCTLKVFRKEIAKDLGLYGELHRFIPVLAHLQGAKITEMPVKHHPRIHGNSKYGLGRTFKVMSDLLLMIFMKKYMQKPIHFFGPIGLASFSIGMLTNLYLLVVKLMGNDIWGRPLLLLGITLVLAGIQFITFGLIMEVNIRTYFESQDKKTYRIREIFTGGKDTNSPLVITYN